MAEPANTSKDTVYIDVDDEITTIIDKVRGSDKRIVALVLPKRAAVLQSVVNMKLLKRSADQSKKQLVLITSEAGLLPLAGSVGLYVADSLNSKPEVPPVPDETGGGQLEEEALSLDDEPDAEYTADNAGDKPVGDLAKAAGAGFVITSGVDTEDENLPSEGEKAATPATSAVGAAAAGKKTKKDKKKVVPSFNKFRTRLGLAAIGLVLLIFLLYLALMVLPKATVAIGANAQDVNSSLNITLDTTASDVDLANTTIPATTVQQQKTYTQQVDATGKQNNGQKATGSVTMTTQTCSPNLFPAPDDIPAGTGVSNNGNSYITHDDASFTQNGGSGSCIYWKSNPVGITAQQGGSNYNVSNANFSVFSHSGVSASGSANGGTDDIQQVVSQSDIDNAKGKINTNDSEIKQALTEQLKQQNLFPIPATFNSGKPTISSSSNAGDKASTVTVTEAVTYTMFGTAKSNLKTLVKDDVGQQVDLDKQAIIDDGISSASFSLKHQTDTTADVSMDNTALVGPKIDMTSLKAQIAGMKSGDAKDLINQLPGVTTVDIKLSPFWVSSIPKNQAKITITVGKAKNDAGS
jgi:hypothetical protein